MRALLLGSVGLCLARAALAADAAPQPAALGTILPAQLELRGDPARLIPEALVPNFGAVSLGGPAGQAWSVRGLGNSTTIAPLDPAVGVFVDGIPLAGRDGQDFALFDLEQVVVRRGGQGALLGRNTSGGSVELALRQPGARFGGYVGGGYGGFDRKQIRGSVDIPLGALAVQVSAYLEDDDGVARNTSTGERLNDSDRAGLRLAARLTPTERLSWTVAAAYTEAKGENLLAFDCDPNGGEGCGGRYLSTGMVKGARLGGVPQYSVPVAGEKAGFSLGSEVATTLVSSKLEWGGEALRLTLTSGFLDIADQSALDFADGRGFPVTGQPVRAFQNGGYAVLTDRQDRQFSQEVRLAGALADGRLRYVAGGQLIDLEQRLDTADLLTLEDGTAQGAPQLVADRVAKTQAQSAALFADLTFAVTDRLELGAGVRFTDETLRLSVRDSACGTGGCLAGAGAPNRQDFRIWTPRASASFRLTDAVTLFAEGARGYRPGGWNVRASTPGALEAYGEETAWTWQGGVASSWLEGRLDAKLTAFALEVDGFQGVMTDLAGGLPQFGQGTLADWRNRGVELELAVRPLDGLSLYANLGLQDAAYRETDAVRASQAACNAGQADACGRGVITAAGAIAEPVGTPDVTLGLGGSFAFAVPTAGIIVTPTADILYRGSQQADTANLAPAIGAHWLVDAGIAIETDDQAWILTFSCRNCLDETAAEQALFGQPYLARPRTLFLAARRRF